MISSQKLILMILLINLLTGILVTGFSGIDTSNHLDTQNDIYSQLGQDTIDDDRFSGVRNRDYDSETSIGNSIDMGANLWEITANALNPFSIDEVMFEGTVEKLIADILGLFRTALYILMVLEIYFIFKNRKTS